jgi:SSS family solute:Na+ symporter
MNYEPSRRLSVFSLAILLVSSHYGLGFLLGTAEQAMGLGMAGSLYAVSVSLGALTSIALVKFYWTEVEQIWTLLGNYYGQIVKAGVGFMSWASLIGIEAVQIIAAAAILNVIGIPKLASMVGLTLLFGILSLLPVERASWVFRGLILVNVLALFYALWRLDGLFLYWRSPLEFIPALEHISPSEAIGVSLSTVLLVPIDMKCQQFIVQARNPRTAALGCLFASLALLALAFLPAAVTIAAGGAGILPPDISGKAVIPYVLAWAGGGASNFWGIMAIAVLTVPALGLGSNVLRIQSKTVLDWQIVPSSLPNRIAIAAVNATLALAIALQGGEIVGLILCFYAAYLSAVWVPFIAYLLARRGLYTFAVVSVRVSLASGSLSALVTLFLTLFHPQTLLFHSPELTIMAIGMGGSIFGLLVSELSKLLVETAGKPEISEVEDSDTNLKREDNRYL